MILSKEVQLPVEDEKNIDASQLFAEKVEKIKECRDSGIFKASFPIAVLTGLANFFGLRAGVIPRAKCGFSYQIFASALTTYVTLEASGTLICIYKNQPLLQENVQKISNQNMQSAKTDEELPSYGAIFDTSADNKVEWDAEGLDTKFLDTDINIQFVYDIDSDRNLEDLKEERPIKNYVTYDKLRQENREKYKNKYNQEAEPPRANLNEQKSKSLLLNVIGKKQTKYGDTWDE